jgi:tetratricopeptide (TPR) repeat protein
VFGLLTAAALIALAEAGLRLAGLGAPPHHDPYAGFAATSPHVSVQQTADGATRLTLAADKARRFNAVDLPAAKPPGTVRVLCVGGSTTYGRPFFHPTSFAGWLELMLPLVDESRAYEVINAGGIGYASYRVKRVLAQWLAAEPDVVIIYTGHNEFLERRTYADLHATPSLVRDAGAVLRRSRLVNLMGALSPEADRVTGSPRIADEIEAIPLNTVGPEAYRRDPAWKDDVVQHFRASLAEMVEMAQAAGAEVVLVEPASNHAGFAPFRSDPTPGLSAQGQARARRLLDEAAARLEAGDAQAALRPLDEALATDPAYAELHYRRGQALAALGRSDEAREAFARAVEEDICPLRAIAAIRDAVRATGRNHAVPVVGFPALLAERSPAGVPGDGFFHDHVHPTVEANRLLAEAIVDALMASDFVAPQTDWRTRVEADATERMQRRIDPRTLAAELTKLARVMRWTERPAEARRARRAAIERLGEAAAQHPDDPTVRTLLGVRLAEAGLHDEAIEHLEAAARLSPAASEAHSNLGLAYARAGRSADAIERYDEAIRLDPGNASAHYNLGLLLENQGRTDKARACFRRALTADAGHDAARQALHRLAAAAAPARPGP